MRQKICFCYGQVNYLTIILQMAPVIIALEVLLENGSICIPPQHIPRGKWGDYSLPASIENGVSAELLQNRPDVRLADCAIAEAYYNTQAARQAFFPTINLSGILGWTNSAGSTVVNPGKLLLNAALSLMQPIFMRGKLKAGLKIAKLSQEECCRSMCRLL